MEKEILYKRPYSHPGDTDLSLVLCKATHPGGRVEYVVWTYSKRNESFFWGHYYRTLQDAKSCYDRKEV